MVVIGITGGMGSGKSTVSRMLSEMGVRVLDADKVGHQLYQPGSPVWYEVVAAFGEGILKPGGEIDRGKLGDIVFADSKALQRLNAITHPRMRERMGEVLEEWRREGVEVVVLEAAVLFEAGWTSLVDEVWVTVIPEDVVVKRLEVGEGLSPEETRARLRSQMSVKEKARRAQVVIPNDGDLKELEKQVMARWQSLNSRLKGCGASSSCS